MGIFNNIKKALTSEWDDSKICCSSINCTVKESGEGIAWMCQRCLNGYCEKHVGSVRFYVMDLEGVTGYKVSDHAAGSTFSDMKKAEDERVSMLFNQIKEWGDELHRDEDPLKWGPITRRENDSYEIEKGFILCKSCAKDIEGEGKHKKIEKAEEAEGVEYNWKSMAMDDIVRKRLGKKYN